MQATGEFATRMMASTLEHCSHRIPPVLTIVLPTRPFPIPHGSNCFLKSRFTWPCHPSFLSAAKQRPTSAFCTHCSPIFNQHIHRDRERPSSITPSLRSQAHDLLIRLNRVTQGHNVVPMTSTYSIPSVHLCLHLRVIDVRVGLKIDISTFFACRTSKSSYKGIGLWNGSIPNSTSLSLEDQSKSASIMSPVSETKYADNGHANRRHQGFVLPP